MQSFKGGNFMVCCAQVFVVDAEQVYLLCRKGDSVLAQYLVNNAVGAMPQHAAESAKSRNATGGASHCTLDLELSHSSYATLHPKCLALSRPSASSRACRVGTEKRG